MNNNRLKLYDDILRLVLDHRTKKALKKIAYKNKMTMSEYVRNLIAIDVLKNHQSELIDDLVHSSELIALKTLRRHFND